MGNCLCCGKPLGANEVDWHHGCIKNFFGIKTLPSINIKEFSAIFLNPKNKEAIITGVQKKVSLHLQKEGDNSRLTLVNYPSEYILKPFSDIYHQLPENEWLTMHLANICDLETVSFGLIRLEDESLAYITKRIDRKGKKKIAMEDFCQLGESLTENKYKSSYEKIGKILEKYSDNIGLDYYKLFNVIIFSFIVGNSDMHLKNFSLYQKKGKSIFSPSYDLLNTLIITEDLEEVALSIDGRKSHLNRKNFFNLAEKYLLNETQIERIFNNFQRKYQMIIDSINNSLLDESLKSAYIKIIDDRYKRLF
ncbi:MAG: HipA domain-containing protein [Spirochaetaceae bacterium]|nr:HipA domain-containing protein [Spirochaetaceae bacterium]